MTHTVLKWHKCHEYLARAPWTASYPGGGRYYLNRCGTNRMVRHRGDRKGTSTSERAWGVSYHAERGEHLPNGKLLTRGHGGLVGVYLTMREAKAAAQAHYDRQSGVAA
jgi:hypothetical protein